MQTHDLSKLFAQTNPTLTASDKVRGVVVLRSRGEPIGTFKTIIINKRTGQVGYGDMNFGGFLGRAEQGHPLVRSDRKFRELPDGYRVALTDDQLGNRADQSTDVHLEIDEANLVSRPNVLAEFLNIKRGVIMDRISSIEKTDGQVRVRTRLKI
jgi:hypothetical protein